MLGRPGQDVRLLLIKHRAACQVLVNLFPDRAEAGASLSVLVLTLRLQLLDHAVFD